MTNQDPEELGEITDAIRELVGQRTDGVLPITLQVHDWLMIVAALRRTAVPCQGCAEKDTTIDRLVGEVEDFRERIFNDETDLAETRKELAARDAQIARLEAIVKGYKLLHDEDPENGWNSKCNCRLCSDALAALQPGDMGEDDG